MAVNSHDPVTGRPIFLDTDAPDIKVDPSEAAKYAADVGNRIVRENKVALDAYDYQRAGLAGHAVDTKTDYVHNGSSWVPRAACLEATATPLLTNGVPTSITGWVIDTNASASHAEVATISGSTVTVKPGRYAVTVLVALNSSGSPRPVSGRSFVEVVAGETLLQPRPRANPAIGEDTWMLSFSRSYPVQTNLTVNVLPQAAVSPMGSIIRLMITRLS